MASLITVRLNKGDAASWGFRLQGGKDFGTPLVIQKVNGGSPAERAGLIAGDSVIKINNTDVFNVRHKDAQDVVVRSGHSFDMTIQRGGSTWKPSVTPAGSFSTAPTPSIQNITPVTKTSLASNKIDNTGAIGTGHNSQAKPFNNNVQVNGNVNGAPKVVNNQYNSPLKLYSEESIAETLSAQTEVLATGALGVNFKKNEKNYDASNSAVFRMVQEADKEPKSQEPEPDSGVITAPLGVAGLRRVAAPETKPAPTTPQLPPGQNICADCERLIVGVFVRIKDKNLHVECFKCATCGTSLKNVGYYNINNKLYCDVHAKLAAINKSLSPNLVPVTVPPGGKAPANAIAAALSSHPYPSPLSPKTNFTAAPFQTGSNSLSGPKPFSSVSAPLSPASLYSKPLPTVGAPLSPVSSTPAAPSYSPLSSTGRFSSVKPGSGGGIFKGHSVQNIVWPPPNTEPEVPTACPLYFPPPSQVHHHQNIKPPIQFEPDSDNSSYYESDDMAHYQIPKMSICSAEVSNITNKSTFECCETISETLATQKLVENVLKNRPPSPPPPAIASSSQSCVETKQSVQGCADDEDDQQVNCDLKRPQDFNPHIPALKPRPKKIENSIPKKWESPMVQALTTASDQPFNANSDDPFSQIPTIKRSSTAFASALSIAPAQPFTPHSASLNMEPIPLPEETVPYFPPDHSFSFSEQNVEKIVEKSDHHIKATTVPQPSLDGGPPPPILRKKKDPTEKFFAELPKPHEKLSMLTALTTASDRCYSPFSTTSSVTDERHSEQQSDFIETKTIERKQLHRPMKPTILPESFNPIITEEEGSKPVGCYPLFKGFSCSFENKTDHSQFKIEICTTPPIPANTDGNNPEVKVTRSGSNNDEECLIESETITKKMHTSEKSSQKQELLTRAIDKQAECVILKKPLPLAEALHRPDSLPQYQVNLSESVNADIELMKRIEAAQQRHDKQKTVQIKEEANIIVDNKREDKVKMQNVNILDRHSEAVYDDDKRTNLSFSPRPRSLTPSMINKPAPVLPYYQASLVAQPCHAPTINLLDPASPAVSRSPSPCPNRRCASPFETKSSSLRPKSPAAGAPPNPLKSSQPLPTQRDFRVEQAKKNVTNYIPQYKSKIDVVERAKGFSTVSSSNNMAEETLQSKNIQLQQQNSGVNSQQNVNIKLENLQVQDCQKNQILREQNQQSGYSSSMSISEKSHLAHLEQLNQSQTQSVQQSSDGRTQVQRKKTVTEEFERTQKSNVIEIEKNTTTTTKSHHHPFRDINTSSITQQEIVGMHLTNPQPLVSPFLKTTSGGCSTTSACSSSNKPAPSISGPKSGPTLSTSSKSAASSGSSLSFKPNRNVNIPNVPKPNAGTGGGRQAGAVGVAPKRGRGVLNAASLGGARVPLCGQCHSQIRGPFITALGKIWCPDHFACATPSCRRPLQDIGFVEEQGQLYCEYCFEQYLAPPCSKCNIKIKGDCLKAIGKKFHPECFNCIYCGKLFASSPFFIEDGNPYCEADWNELFTTKCFACGFPVEAGDRWVEALNNNYHSQCFNCTMCKKNLEGQSFFAKGGRPFCKAHAR